MPRRKRYPEDPEVLEAIMQRIRDMTREELLQELSWRPEGVEETWRMQRTPTEPGPIDREGPLPEADGDIESMTPDQVAASRPNADGR